MAYRPALAKLWLQQLLTLTPQEQYSMIRNTHKDMAPWQQQFSNDSLLHMSLLCQHHKLYYCAAYCLVFLMDRLDMRQYQVILATRVAEYLEDCEWLHLARKWWVTIVSLHANNPCSHSGHAAVRLLDAYDLPMENSCAYLKHALRSNAPSVYDNLKRLPSELLERCLSSMYIPYCMPATPTMRINAEAFRRYVGKKDLPAPSMRAWYLHQLWRLGVALKVPEAMFRMHQATMVRGETFSCLAWLQEAAQHGHREACFQLGMLYYLQILLPVCNTGVTSISAAMRHWGLAKPTLKETAPFIASVHKQRGHIGKAVAVLRTGVEHLNDPYCYFLLHQFTQKQHWREAAYERQWPVRLGLANHLLHYTPLK